MSKPTSSTARNWSGPLHDGNGQRPAGAYPGSKEADLTLTADKRQEQILEFIEQRGWLSVAEISSEFGVSSVTARHDLFVLADSGNIQRIRGGDVGDLEHAPQLLEMARGQAIDGKAVVYPHRRTSSLLAVSGWDAEDERRYLAG